MHDFGCANKHMLTFHERDRAGERRIRNENRKLKFEFFLFPIAALTVRYLTRRFIGEYRSKTDLLYRQTISLDSGLLDVEIVDVSHESDNDFPIEQIQWADACLIVYSITDRESFKYATRSLANIKSLQNNSSAYLIANKSDLDHLREVSFRCPNTFNKYSRRFAFASRQKHTIPIKIGFISAAQAFLEQTRVSRRAQECFVCQMIAACDFECTSRSHICPTKLWHKLKTSDKRECQLQVRPMPMLRQSQCTVEHSSCVARKGGPKEAMILT